MSKCTWRTVFLNGGAMVNSSIKVKGNNNEKTDLKK